MSLRPTFAGFKLERLTSLFGCKKLELIAELVDLYDEMYMIEDDNERDEIQHIIHKIIMGEFEENPVEVENEQLQLVMICLAGYGTGYFVSDSIFWEAFLVFVEQNRDRVEGEIGQLIRYLFDGRPLIGESIHTDWTFYAYFTYEEAKKLMQFIWDNGKVLQGEFDFETALEWWREVEDKRADVWFYAS